MATRPSAWSTTDCKRGSARLPGPVSRHCTRSPPRILMSTSPSTSAVVRSVAVARARALPVAASWLTPEGARTACTIPTRAAFSAGSRDSRVVAAWTYAAERGPSSRSVPCAKCTGRPSADVVVNAALLTTVMPPTASTSGPMLLASIRATWVTGDSGASKCRDGLRHRHALQRSSFHRAEPWIEAAARIPEAAFPLQTFAMRRRADSHPRRHRQDAAELVAGRRREQDSGPLAMPEA